MNSNGAIVRMVIADDHAVVRAGISAALSDLPQVRIVAEVDAGPALMQALVHQQPDALVIDVSMPGFDPLRDIAQIRAQYPQMRILVVSAYDDDVYVQGLLRVGVNGYHLKDQSLGDLRLAVQRVLAGERWLSGPLLSRLIQPQPTPSLQLTQRQRELLWCLQQGDDNHTIARRTGLSVKTVENHLTRLYRQLNVQSRLEAVHMAAQHTDLPLPLTDLPAAAPLTILVVDDNSRYRHQLQRMVGAIYPHARVVEAATASEALEAARHEQPAVVLLDVVLGDDDGIQCAQDIHAQVPAAQILLISAYPDRAFQRRGLAAGALALIDKKDLDRASLREILADCLER